MRKVVSILCAVALAVTVVAEGGSPLAEAATFTKPVTRFVLGADMNKDGRGEILAVDASGRLLMFAGRSDGRLGSSYQLGTGWGSMQVFGPGDLNGDGKSDILGINTSGDLFMYPGNGVGSLGKGVKVGYGWNGWKLVPSGDLNGDKKVDLLGVSSAGDLYMYPGKGNGKFGSRVKVGYGWKGWSLYAAGDLNGDKKADILGINAAGDLYQYLGKGNGTFGARTKVGYGWIGNTLAAGADLTGDGKADIVSRNELNGNLYFFKGLGNGKFASKVQIDTGWSKTYSVSFNVNGGIGYIAPKTCAKNGVITLPAGISRNWYSFVGWNTNSSGTGTTYPAKGSYTCTGSNITLYAKWKALTNLEALEQLEPGIPISQPGAKGPYALQGTITGSNGKRVGAGVPVYMFAAPSVNLTKKVTKVGQFIENPLVAVTLTDSTGAYAFTEASVVGRLKSMQSTYQEITVPTAGLPSSTHVNLLSKNKTTQTPSNAKIAVAPGASATKPVTGLATHNGALKLTAASRTALEFLEIMKTTPKPPVAADIDFPPFRPEYPPTPPQQGMLCSLTPQTSRNYEMLLGTWLQPVVVGATGSRSSFSTMQFVYSVNSSSELGVAFSVSAKKGESGVSFTQGITMSSFSSHEWTAPAKDGMHYSGYKSNFYYGLYQNYKCMHGYWTASLDYTVKPTGMHGGTGVDYPALYSTLPKNPNYCSDLTGQTVIRKGEGIVWRNGVSVNHSIGFVQIKAELTSKTDYSDLTSIKISGSRKIFVCGQYGPALSNGGFVYASDTIQ